MARARLERVFFARDAEEVARDLLGTHLCVRGGGGTQRAGIGIDYADEWVDAPLRFVDADSVCLSRPLPAAARR